MLSNHHIDHMKVSRAVTCGTHVLPSLVTVCRKRGLPTEGGAVQLKKRLREDRSQELLRCPVCYEKPCQEDIVVVCGEGHHMCFGCLMQLRKAACPQCAAPLRPAAPGQLLRQLLEYECVVSNTAPLLPLYRTIMSCCFPKDCVWSFAAIRRFGLLMATAEGRKSVHQCALSIQATDATRRCLEEAVRKVQRRVQVSSESSSSDSTESDDD
jgi:hypothetical protein